MRRALRTVVCLLVLSLAGSAAADELAERHRGEDLVVLHKRVEYRLADDGAFTKTVAMAWTPLTEAGREELKTRELYFNRALATITVEEACSVSSRGERRCTDPGDVVEQPRAGKKIVAGSHEPYELVVPFEELQIGSRLELRWRVDARDGLEHHFGSSWAGGSTGPLETAEFVVSHPTARPLYGHLVGGEADYEVVEEGTRTLHTWRFGPQPARPDDDDRPKTVELVPVLYVTEFADWQAFASWYLPHLEQAAERFRGAAAREVKAEAEARVDKLEPVLRWGLVLQDRLPASSVDVSLGTLIPGAMETMVRRPPTQVDKTVALWTLLRDDGVDAHVAFATRHRVGVPADLPSPLPFEDLVVYVEGRGVIDGDSFPEFVDTVPSHLRGGTVVVLDPAGVRVLEREVMDPPEARPGWHRDGRVTISGGEVRVDEVLTFSGSSRAAARSRWRNYQNNLDSARSHDRKMKAKYAGRPERAPDETAEHYRTRWYAHDRAYGVGRVRDAEMFDPWDLDAEPEVHVRYVPDELCVVRDSDGGCERALAAYEEVGNLILVRLPLTVHGESGRCAAARPQRDAPVKTTAWTHTFTYDLVIPDGYELVGVPQDREVAGAMASLSITYREADIPPVEDDEEEKARKKKDDEDEEPAGPRPGVIVEASYQLHTNRVPLDEYDTFRAIAAVHALAFTDPIVLQKAARPD